MSLNRASSLVTLNQVWFESKCSSPLTALILVSLLTLQYKSKTDLFQLLELTSITRWKGTTSIYNATDAFTYVCQSSVYWVRHIVKSRITHFTDTMKWSQMNKWPPITVWIIRFPFYTSCLIKKSHAKSSAFFSSSQMWQQQNCVSRQNQMRHYSTRF